MGCPSSPEERTRVDDGRSEEKDFQAAEEEAEDALQGRKGVDTGLPSVWRSEAIPSGLPDLWVLS